MSRLFVLTFSVLLFLASSYAQLPGSSTSPATRKPPTRVEDYSLEAKPRFLRLNQLHPNVRTSIQAEALLGAAVVKITSIPHWSNSFTTAGKRYPYTMVGIAPKNSASSRIPTALLPVTFVFDAYKDSAGHRLVISPSGVLTKIKKSPNWVSAPYSTGHTQFADAVQRAQFYKTMASNWHTLLNAPRTLPTATVVVPAGMGRVYKTTSGVVYAKIDSDLFESAMTRILSSADLRPGEFALAVSRNILIYQFGRLGNCCILGFHTAFQSDGTSTNPVIQTFGWASWLDKGIFKNTDLTDVMAVSHEISEWINDPFVDNETPAWSFPDGYGCQANLETADPIEVLDNISIPVTVSGYTYHPQTQAMLQWFSREKPSSAIHGTYSYPDLSALRSPSKPCS